MRHSRRVRFAAIALLTGGLCAVAPPARAASGPGVAAAQQALSIAQQNAHAAATAVGAARQQVAGAQQQLALAQARVAALDQAVATDTTQVQFLTQQVAADKASLATYLRSVYKSGGAEAALAYIITSANISDAVDRFSEMDRVDRAGGILLGRIAAAEAGARQALADATTSRAQARVAQEQATTAAAVVAIEEQQLAQAAAIADAQVTTARSHYSSAVAAARAAAAAQAAAAAAAAAARSGGGVVYHPVPGPLFTIDTDLTKPSGESAATLNSFLAGTALAGLGGSFMNAETTYHVSARYLVAHAILESAWGTSAIAHDKHNLFGYGANDANPYGDAMSFSSFAACIQFVAQVVATSYLSPSGPFYHGPTLRGMNVDYASDPAWAVKIAAIATTVPV